MAEEHLPADVLALDDLQILVVVDNETDPLSSVDDGVPRVAELATMVARTPPGRVVDGHECRVVLDDLCAACHGLSLLVTGRRGDQVHRLLFDVGPNAGLWLDNARRLGVDLASIDTIFLSHWHFDHSGALPEVATAVARARHAAGRPAPVIDVHPDRPDQRGLLTGAGGLLLLPPEPSIGALLDAGADVRTHADAHPVADGFFHGTGAIDRVTGYEAGLPGHYSLRADRAEPDPLIMDERCVAAYVPGRGVTVLSACSHAGIVNACTQVRKEFADAPVDLVLGGFHLAGAAMEDRIAPTLHDLREDVAPRLLAPGHCTGWRAKAALADAFTPGRYAPSVVGARYQLTAQGRAA